MTTEPKAFITVQWKGVNRRIEYVPMKGIAGRLLLLSEILEYKIKGRWVLILTVCETAPGSQPYRTAKWGMRRAEMLRRLRWNGKEPIGVRFVKPGDYKEKTGHEQPTNVGNTNGSQAEASTDDGADRQSADDDPGGN